MVQCDLTGGPLHLCHRALKFPASRSSPTRGGLAPNSTYRKGLTVTACRHVSVSTVITSRTSQLHSSPLGDALTVPPGVQKPWAQANNPHALSRLLLLVRKGKHWRNPGFMAVLEKEKATEEKFPISLAVSGLHSTETQGWHSEFSNWKSPTCVVEGTDMSLDKSTHADGYRRASHRKYFS